MSKYDDNMLIAKYAEDAQYIAAKEQALKTELAPKMQRMEAIKAELMKRLIERGAGNTTTSSGTAYLSHHLNVKVPDIKALLAWAQADWDNRAGIIVIRPPVDEVRDYMALNNGADPPGTTHDVFTRINIKGKGNGKT